MKKIFVFIFALIINGQIFAAETTDDYFTPEKINKRFLALLSNLASHDNNNVASFLLSKHELDQIKLTKCGHTTISHAREKHWLCETCKKTVKPKELLPLPEEIRQILQLMRIFVNQNEELKQMMQIREEAEKKEPTLAEIARQEALKVRIQKRADSKQQFLGELQKLVPAAAKKGLDEIEIGSVYNADGWWKNKQDVENFCIELSKEAGVRVQISYSYLDEYNDIRRMRLSAYW